MLRFVLVLLIFTISASCLLAQTTTADSLYLIPCGPFAGTFSPEARITVNDTVAGWAKIQVEGWVPVSVVLPRIKALSDSLSASQPVITNNSSAAEKESSQCEATTQKGNRCSRKAKPGSRFCWQHQPNNPSEQK